MTQLKIERFALERFGIKLTKHQLEMVTIMAASPEREFILAHQGRYTGKTTAYKCAIAYLQEGLKPVDTANVDRVEVIDGTGRAYVKGSVYGTPVKVGLSYQDEGKTLKVFVDDK